MPPALSQEPGRNNGDTDTVHFCTSRGRFLRSGPKDGENRASCRYRRQLGRRTYRGLRKMTRTMLVGADRALLNETADFLREAGSQALVVADVARAEREISRFRPEMIVVSLDDAEANGWKFMFRHGFNGGAKVIATTVNGHASQELTVLRLGAQDYIRMPVSPEVLFARIAFRARPVDRQSDHIVEHSLEVTSKRGMLVMDKS